MTCLCQVTVVALVPPIALDLVLLTEAGDRTAFASVHTIICGAAPLSADVERQLKRRTGAVRVQQGKTHDLICCLPVVVQLIVIWRQIIGVFIVKKKMTLL